MKTKKTSFIVICTLFLIEEFCCVQKKRIPNILFYQTKKCIRNCNILKRRNNIENVNFLNKVSSSQLKKFYYLYLHGNVITYFQPRVLHSRCQSYGSASLRHSREIWAPHVIKLYATRGRSVGNTEKNMKCKENEKEIKSKVKRERKLRKGKKTSPTEIKGGNDGEDRKEVEALEDISNCEILEDEDKKLNNKKKRGKAAKRETMGEVLGEAEKKTKDKSKGSTKKSTKRSAKKSTKRSAKEGEGTEGGTPASRTAPVNRASEQMEIPFEEPSEDEIYKETDEYFRNEFIIEDTKDDEDIIEAKRGSQKGMKSIETKEDKEGDNEPAGKENLNPQEEEEKMERKRKIEFIKRVEFLLQEDEKNEKLFEEREDIEKLRFGEKPPPGSEELMQMILKNVHDENFRKQNDTWDLKKKHLFYELFRISNSNSFKTHKIYTHDDLIHGMKYRKLGESNLCVSEICIGTNMYENENFISADDVNVLLNMAFYEYGINFFDICEYDPFPHDPISYKKGKNKNMNLFLKNKKRENIVINLRMCSSRNVDKITNGEYYLSWIMEDLKDDVPNFYNIEERLDKILKNLNTNYVDILTIDLPERYIPNGGKGEDTYIWGFENLNSQQNEEKKENILSIEEQFDILEKLILKGKVRHIAVSNESVWGVYQWCNLAKKKKKKYMKIVCTQNLYNLLHRNEVESSGLVEMILKENYNVPLVPYGLLAGGILTGKYLDPERYHTMGPDTVLGDDQLDHDLDDSRGNLAEDYGYLSYGPRNGRCNKYPHLYKSHRCVWAQDATAEYMKLARSHGMSLAQLSLSFVYSRPFVASSIIGPRTIGQLKDSVLCLNYPMYQHTECDIHEIFLRYRGCTMDGNTILNSLEDPNKTSQTAFYKSANIPILSGGTHWNNYPLPFLMKKYEYTDLKEEHDRMKSTFGLNDEPNDSNFISSRIWVEREKKKGEYFALKESVLFEWDKYKIYKGVMTKLSDKEKYIYDTSDFHFYFKNNTISVVPTDEEISNFYQNKEKIKKIINQTINDCQELYQYQEQLGQDMPDIFNNLNIDLIYKQLLNRHNINPLDKNELNSIYQYIKLTPSEIKTEDFWYIYNYNPLDTSFAVRTGTEP
ncbi:oxidoreductase, aldo/keto reductase domain containing protein [Plasmodium gonderi]|uniref:Oxidoreductase, aldo/keto reductase domain containing protein n=1 Tax=Plasmodium gonderi TaxID=77519 RepID=A0A1Y1JKS9_PLAGO|nr:oxidoreductase, aldo/keto reductase domain containing protein [Plasmodium gonderi]GAW83126.1 oxidoreductase, aldo/keto reductase domain containing protein [Plasmodium gonderi]